MGSREPRCSRDGHSPGALSPDARTSSQRGRYAPFRAAARPAAQLRAVGESGPTEDQIRLRHLPGESVVRFLFWYLPRRKWVIQPDGFNHPGLHPNDCQHRRNYGNRLAIPDRPRAVRRRHRRHRSLAHSDRRQNGRPKRRGIDGQICATEELKYSPTGNPSLQAKQMGELSMAYEDCDTIPLLWTYADRFVLFDNIFESMTGPSTPGNLSIIGAQSGLTQWALHPNQSATVPVISDPNPFWGSPSDKSASPLPVNPTDYPGYTTAPNLTFATLPLSMLLSTANSVTATDP